MKKFKFYFLMLIMCFVVLCPCIVSADDRPTSPTEQSNNYHIHFTYLTNYSPVIIEEVDISFSSRYIPLLVRENRVSVSSTVGRYSLYFSYIDGTTIVRSSNNMTQVSGTRKQYSVDTSGSTSLINTIAVTTMPTGYTLYDASNVPSQYNYIYDVNGIGVWRFSDVNYNATHILDLTLPPTLGSIDYFYRGSGYLENVAYNSGLDSPYIYYGYVDVANSLLVGFDSQYSTEFVELWCGDPNNLEDLKYLTRFQIDLYRYDNKYRVSYPWNDIASKYPNLTRIRVYLRHYLPDARQVSPFSAFDVSLGTDGQLTFSVIHNDVGNIEDYDEQKYQSMQSNNSYTYNYSSGNIGSGNGQQYIVDFGEFEIGQIENFGTRFSDLMSMMQAVLVVVPTWLWGLLLFSFSSMVTIGIVKMLL